MSGIKIPVSAELNQQDISQQIKQVEGALNDLERRRKYGNDTDKILRSYHGAGFICLLEGGPRVLGWT